MDLHVEMYSNYCNIVIEVGIVVTCLMRILPRTSAPCGPGAVNK